MPTELGAGRSPAQAEQDDSLAVVKNAMHALAAGRRIGDADGAIAAAMASLDSRLAMYASRESNGLPVRFSPQALALRAALEANRT